MAGVQTILGTTVKIVGVSNIMTIQYIEMEENNICDVNKSKQVLLQFGRL